MKPSIKSTKRAKSANASRPSSSIAFREDYGGTGSNDSMNSNQGYGKSSHSRSPPQLNNSNALPGTTPSLNGSYSSNGNNEMLEVKISRKRAESDLQLLANRLVKCNPSDIYFRLKNAV